MDLFLICTIRTVLFAFAFRIDGNKRALKHGKRGQSGQGQNGHFHFRIRSSAHYNINILFIYSADFDNLFSILT